MQFATLNTRVLTNAAAQYYTEHGYAGDERRVVRVLNGKRTHNIALNGCKLWWENNDSGDWEFEFNSIAEATAWWNKHFAKCTAWNSNIK